MAQSTTHHVLPLEFDFDLNNVKVVTHELSMTDDEGNTTTFEATVPEVPMGATKMFVMYFILQFNLARERCRWTSAATLYSMFPIHFGCITDLNWWNTKTKVTGVVTQASSADQSVEAFDALVRQYVGWKIQQKDAYARHMTFLFTLKKPTNMRVSDFVSLLEWHYAFLPWLPGAPEADAELDEERRKLLLFIAMPIEWQGNFETAGKQLNTTDFDDLVSFMCLLEELAARSKSNRQGNRNNNRDHWKNRRNGSN